MNKLFTGVSFLLIASVIACNPKKDSNDLENAVILYAAARIATCSVPGTTVSNASATLNTGTGCINGLTTSMDAALPDWIKNNFKCSVGQVSGSTYILRSQNIPNTKSFYFGSSSPMYEALPSGHKSAGNNQIQAQCLVYSIPSVPTVKTGAKTSTQAGYVSVGITTNGLAIFNNAAAPPDTLAAEVTTFDNFNGHPQNTGVYHHHALPKNLSDETNGDANLLGILLDGYAVYGEKCDNGTQNPGDDTVPNNLDSNHGHTTTTVHFTTATYHYHYTLDNTATIKTLIGGSFHGTPGTVSN
ncbi:YHYH protein [Leptospira sp. 96542]|nr:YHYH protein [Leptospira sp. 96542]